MQHQRAASCLMSSALMNSSTRNKQRNLKHTNCSCWLHHQQQNTTTAHLCTREKIFLKSLKKRRGGHEVSDSNDVILFFLNHNSSSDDNNQVDFYWDRRVNRCLCLLQKKNKKWCREKHTHVDALVFECVYVCVCVCEADSVCSTSRREFPLLTGNQSPAGAACHHQLWLLLIRLSHAHQRGVGLKLVSNKMFQN